VNWQNVELLDRRFVANCDALATRDPEMAIRLRSHRPAEPYVLAAENDELRIARVVEQTAHVLPHRLSPHAAMKVVEKLCPGGTYVEPVLIAGMDQGWLWQQLHQLPIESPMRPGHRPALFLWAREWDELWWATHVHDWRELLADPRVLLLVGEDAYSQTKKALLANSALGTPRLSVTLDPAIWPAGRSLDTLSAEVSEVRHHRLLAANDRVRALYAGVSEHEVAAKLRGGSGLRVMGITSRFTTFLQHSMRDWLAAFESAGNPTRLMIEEADHEQLNSLVLAEGAAEFRPDLILMIDHFRAELGGLPANCPAVMWIQDHLPNIHSPAAGAAQGPWDYVIGYHRTECTRRFGYPFERFMAASIGVNDERFAPVELTEEEAGRFGCDVSYVSHASKPAERIVQETIGQIGSEQAAALLVTAFERLKGVYDQGWFLTHPLHLRGIIEQSCVETKTAVEPEVMQRLTDLFVYRINNALFRHQVLEWVAETGVDLRIYGKGWEEHPRLGRFARGVADNARELRSIYRASRINLQAMPHGIMHQRLLEGLASGGFFLCRYVPGDVIDRVYKPLWAWCVENGIETDDQLIQRATPGVLKMLGELQRTLGLDPFKLGMALVDDMRHGADVDFVRSPAFWSEYDQVAFDSKARLHERIGHFLAHPEERESLTNSMRARVLDRLSYKAVNRRMLEFIADELGARQAHSAAAVAA
jgi:hypothetical protein